MEAKLAALLCCMVRVGIATTKDSVNQIDIVKGCISQCPFSTLEKAMNKEENRLNLWTTFHHPREAFPHYLVVNYSANVTSDDMYDKYLWTSNSIYFVIPPHVFGILSLFMGMLDDDHTGELNLTLPEECSCWLNGDLYFTDKKYSLMNYLEILTEKLRDMGNVSGIPQSVSNYQYQSSAVRAENLSDVYHAERESNAFFSFTFGFPILAIFAYAIIVFSQHKKIRKKMMKRKHHQNFAALIGLGLTFALCTTVLDGIAVFWHRESDKTTNEVYYNKENSINHKLHPFLIASFAFEIIFCVVGGSWAIFLCICQCWRHSKSKCKDCEKKCCTRISDKNFCKQTFGRKVNYVNDHFWWTLLLLFIPPIWCLASHFGFIIIAWSSFVRHSKSLTLLYVFIVTVMFLVMRQSYMFIVNIYYYYYADLINLTKEERKEKQEDDGILVWAILLVLTLVGAPMVGFFTYLMFGLWLLPVTDLVEESPVYLYDSLQLIVIVIAILVSYQLVSFQENKIKKILKEDLNKSLIYIKKLLKLKISKNHATMKMRRQYSV